VGRVDLRLIPAPQAATVTPATVAAAVPLPDVGVLIVCAAKQRAQRLKPAVADPGDESTGVLGPPIAASPGSWF
jgi:hypothetical protein